MLINSLVQIKLDALLYLEYWYSLFHNCQRLICNTFYFSCSSLSIMFYAFPRHFVHLFLIGSLYFYYVTVYVSENFMGEKTAHSSSILDAENVIPYIYQSF